MFLNPSRPCARMNGYGMRAAGGASPGGELAGGAPGSLVPPGSVVGERFGEQPVMTTRSETIPASFIVRPPLLQARFEDDRRTLSSLGNHSGFNASRYLVV